MGGSLGFSEKGGGVQPTLVSAISGARRFRELAEWANDIYVATAWGHSAAPPFRALRKHVGKIRQLVVGLHFYQTEPRFLREFQNHPALRVIKLADGTFHPKVYVFVKGERCTWLVGSSNLTQGGFATNQEVNVLFRGARSHLSGKEVLALVDAWHEKGSAWGPDELEEYERSYRALRSYREKLTAGSKPQRPVPAPHAPADLNLDWAAFVRTLRAHRSRHDFGESLDLLATCRRKFSEYKSLARMSPDDRRLVAGIGEVWSGWFGSMAGHGTFKHAVLSAPGKLDSALAHIPSTGRPTLRQWGNFVRAWRHAFRRARLATATRLLAMKRPDLFICVNAGNARPLASAFDVAAIRLKRDFATYWKGMLTIWSLPWHVTGRPKSNHQRTLDIWRARVALLDVLYYRPA